MAKNMEISLLFDFYGDMLTEKQGNMIEFYYNDDLSLAEIAENEGITRQGVRDSIKRAESQLLEMEDRLGLAKRFHEMKNGFESIKVAARDIQEFNARYGFSKDIEERAVCILEVSHRLSEI
ncbi:MAG: YlxM family DNA-binding protein [Oscillospiraceae bacterium]|nr:YlxM family DNA-binding protein [Oscillospiraceae bacterium]MDD3832976.1 YlxM family DNA-binding protein [Oscillospiraceae bacterium]MDD4546490.1 YlxM family DNA-binding protein [Oscillospiraceae bacterium]